MKIKRPLRGGEQGRDVHAVQRALNKWSPGVSIPVSKVYDRTTSDRMQAFQAGEKIKPATGNMGQRSLDALWPFFDAYGRMLYRTYKVPAPEVPWSNVGAVTKRRVAPFLWDKSLLDYAPTHDTSGIRLFPAVDLAWGAGVSMYAPEGCVVDTRDSSANPGEALYLTLDCGLRIWMAHIDRDYPLGRRFKKGEFIARTVDTAIGGGPHGHVGVNGEEFLGKGKQFLYGRDGDGPDYTTGSPTYRQQLEQTLV